MTEINEIVVIVKWSGKEYPLTDLTDQDTVEVLRHEIFRKTQVRPERQKLLNLKHKGELQILEIVQHTERVQHTDSANTLCLCLQENRLQII